MSPSEIKRTRRRILFRFWLLNIPVLINFRANRKLEKIAVSNSKLVFFLKLIPSVDVRWTKNSAAKIYAAHVFEKVKATTSTSQINMSSILSIVPRCPKFIQLKKNLTKIRKDNINIKSMVLPFKTTYFHTKSLFCLNLSKTPSIEGFKSFVCKYNMDLQKRVL